MEVRIDLGRYIEAGFDTIWQVFEPPGDTSKWIVGFFCQGVESSLNDGLICCVPCHGEPERIRQEYLSPACDTIQQAIDGAYMLFKKNSHLFDRRARRCGP